MVISNHFLCNDLESSSWNNHKKTGCLEFQVDIFKRRDDVGNVNVYLGNLKQFCWTPGIKSSSLRYRFNLRFPLPKTGHRSPKIGKSWTTKRTSSSSSQGFCVLNLLLIFRDFQLQPSFPILLLLFPYFLPAILPYVHSFSQFSIPSNSEIPSFVVSIETRLASARLWKMSDLHGKCDPTWLEESGFRVPKPNMAMANVQFQWENTSSNPGCFMAMLIFLGVETCVSESSRDSTGITKLWEHKAGTSKISSFSSFTIVMWPEGSILRLFQSIVYCVSVG